MLLRNVIIALILSFLSVPAIVNAETATERKFDEFRLGFRAILSDPTLANDSPGDITQRSAKYSALTQKLNAWAEESGLFVSKHLDYWAPFFEESHPALNGGRTFKTITDPAELETYRITIKKGNLFKANGKRLDTSDGKNETYGSKSITGRYLYVMDALGRVYFFPTEERYKIHHSSILGGMPVAAAGEMWVKNGILQGISDFSGHYQAQRLFTAQFQKILREGGIPEKSYLAHLMGGAGLQKHEREEHLANGIRAETLEPFSHSQTVTSILRSFYSLNDLRDSRNHLVYFSTLQPLLAEADNELMKKPFALAQLLSTFIKRAKYERADNQGLLQIPEFLALATRLVDTANASLSGADPLSHETISIRASALLIEQLFLKTNRLPEIGKLVLSSRAISQGAKILTTLADAEESLLLRITPTEFNNSISERIEILSFLLSQHDKLAAAFPEKSPQHMLAVEARNSGFALIDRWLNYLSINATKEGGPQALAAFRATDVEKTMAGEAAAKSWITLEEAQAKLADIITRTPELDPHAEGNGAAMNVSTHIGQFADAEATAKSDSKSLQCLLALRRMLATITLPFKFR